MAHAGQELSFQPRGAGQLGVGGDQLFGVVAKGCFHPLPLGHVAHDGRVEFELTLGVVVAEDDLRDRDRLPLPDHDIGLAPPHTRARGGGKGFLVDDPQCACGVGIRDHERLALRRSSQGRAEGAIEIQDRALRIGHSHEVGRSFDNVGEPAQLLFYLRAHGDICRECPVERGQYLLGPFLLGDFGHGNAD